VASVPSLLPSPRLPAAIQPALLERAEHRMLSPARRAGYELSLVGATVLPQRQVITRTQWGTWLFVDHVEDPTAQQYKGKIPIPAAQHEKLVRLDQFGVSPDVVWLGHQQPTGWEEGDPVVVPPPRQLRENDQRLTLQLQKTTSLFLKGAAGLMTAAAAPLALTAAVGAGLDPIVLGGVRHQEYPVVQWVLLAQWEWE
jgi:hypothetical protein